MKNNAVTGILAIAVVILYILHFSTNNGTAPEVIDEKHSTVLDSVVGTQDSSADMLSLSDTLSLDSLKEADYSRIGFINMFKVVEKCPALKKDIKKLETQQAEIQRQEAQIYKNFENDKNKMQKALENMNAIGRLDEATYQQKMQEMAQKQKQAEQEVLALKPKADNLQRSQMNITTKRNEVVQKAIDEINEKLQLDYVLVQDGMNTSVFPLNAKNDITDQIILVINK